MKYTYNCYTHGEFDIESPIAKGPPDVVYCKECREESVRVWTSKPIHYNTQGFHVTDYDSKGDKLERFNKSWGATKDNPPPPPARDIPKNASEPI